jgi:carbonic anhydrase
VAVGLANKTLRLHGWIFDIESGAMLALDGPTGKFLPLADNPDIYAV